MSEDAPKKPAKAGLIRRLFRRGVVRWMTAASVVVALGGVVMIAVAEHQTAKPGFCGSCHVMEPYYASWKVDVHGAKHDIACVECHYAPGERTTVKAKFKGLSQLLSYTTGRYGASRPRAHVSDKSCLTSKCHGDLKFMDKPLWVGTVKFVHSGHLRADEKKIKASERRLAEVRKTLAEVVGQERIEELVAVAQLSGAAEIRYGQMRDLCAKWGAAVEGDLLEELSQLLHRRVRIAQLGDVHCTNCHEYGGSHAGVKVGGNGSDPHFAVHTTTCFTCHFSNEAFNTGTGSCLTCHTLPTEEITIHKEMDPAVLKKLELEGMPTKAIKMDHADILARNVDCISCHADLSQNHAPVSRRDCQRCHDQSSYLKDWTETPSLDLVTRYHKTHIQDQRAKCLDCHSEIKHELVSTDDMDRAHGFLPPALRQCTHCHPSHHQEQVKMLLGRGGSGVADSDPNPMFGSRTNCYGCHTSLGADMKGQHVLGASEKSCVACHGEQYGEMFQQWKEGVQMTLEDADATYQDARKTLDENTVASPEARRKATELLSLAQSDLDLVKRANGIHNVTFAIELLDAVTTNCSKAMTALEGD